MSITKGFDRVIVTIDRNTIDIQGPRGANKVVKLLTGVPNPSGIAGFFDIHLIVLFYEFMHMMNVVESIPVLVSCLFPVPFDCVLSRFSIARDYE